MTPSGFMRDLSPNHPVQCHLLQFHRVYTGMATSWTPAVGGLIVSVCVCVSADMSPYCPAHDEWLIMKLCMYVGYHDANNVSNFGGDPVIQLNLKNVKFFIYAVLWARRSIAVTRPLVLRMLLSGAHRLLVYGRPTPASNGHSSLSTALVRGFL